MPTGSYQEILEHSVPQVLFVCVLTSLACFLTPRICCNGCECPLVKHPSITASSCLHLKLKIPLGSEPRERHLEMCLLQFCMLQHRERSVARTHASWDGHGRSAAMVPVENVVKTVAQGRRKSLSPGECCTGFSSLRKNLEARCSSFHVQGSRKLQCAYISFTGHRMVDDENCFL